LLVSEDNVTALEVQTTLEIPVSRVLEKAAHLKSVVVIGYDEDGKEYFASSMSDGGDVVWLVERFKRMLLDNADE
jgi:hypothetical protein